MTRRSRRRARLRASRAATALLALAAGAAAHQDPGAAFEHALEPLRVDVTLADGEYLDRAYGRAFGELGVEVDGQSEDEALAILREHGVERRAALALDGWARACVVLGSAHYERSNRRIALALAADPDPGRTKLRRALLETPLLQVHEVALALSKEELAPETAIHVAETLEYAEDVEACIATLTAAVERHPDDFALRLAAGHHLAGAGRVEKARTHLEAARELEPESPWPLVALGRASRIAGEYAAAREACDAALALDPDFYPAHRVLSHVAQLAPSEALEIASYREMLRLDPDDATGHNNLAWILATAADEELWEPERAVHHAEEALRLEPDEAAFVNTLGVALYRARELDRCIATLDRSLELSPGGVPSDFLVLSLAWHALGDDDLARELHAKAVARIEKESAVAAVDARLLDEVEEALGIGG